MKPAFPGSTDRKRSFRTCSNVFLARKNPSRSAGPSRLIVTNVHIVSGKSAIRGRQARTTFKQSMLTAVVNWCLRLADTFPTFPAQGGGDAGKQVVALIAGDMNMGRNDVAAAIKDVEETHAVEALCMHHVAENKLLPYQMQGQRQERDFIMSSSEGTVATLSRDWL